MHRFLAIALMFIMLPAAAGCLGSAPGKALHDVALALERKDSAAFLAKLDMGRFAAAHADNMTRGNPALRALDDLAGRFLGMGIGDMVQSVTSMEAALTEDFRGRVSSGELVNECAQASSPGCLWEPASLRSARIRELDAQTAVAQVTVPGNIAGWLALAVVNGEWKVVGLAPQEEQAIGYAKAPPVAPPAPAPGKATNL